MAAACSTLSFKQLQLTLLFHDIFYQDQERGASEDEAEARSKDEVGGPAEAGGAGEAEAGEADTGGADQHSQASTQQIR